MKFKCSSCGLYHEGWPAIAFDSPHFYHILSAKDKEEIAELTKDTCIIRHSNQTDYFIRVVLNQKVNDDHYKNLEYGVWVSLSEKSFNNYIHNFDSNEEVKGYFGYLANIIPGYQEITESIKTDVNLRTGNLRPEIVPHHDQMEISFVKDYFTGISKDEAVVRINRALGSV